MEAGRYDSLIARNQEAVPVWPEESYAEIIKVAFRDRTVADPDHEILKDLRGQ